MHKDTPPPLPADPATASPAVGDEAEDLGPAVDMLESDPGNLPAWLRVATRLYDEPDAAQADRVLARQALDSVAGAFGEAGHLPLAIAACRRLAQRGDERLAWARLMGLGNAYGKTSTRVDPTVQPRPPAPPRATPAPAPPPSRVTERASGAVLRARAVAALRKAAAHAINVQQMAAVQSRQLREPLPAVPLFSALLPDAFVKLAQELSELELPAKAHILTAGEVGESIYIIARGTVRIEREDGTVLARLRSGAFFGEVALLTASRRSAHAIAETPVLLLRVGRAALEQISLRDESIARVLAEHARRRLLQNVMLTSQLFRVLDGAAREQLMARFSFRGYDPGQVLIEDGQPGAELMVVVSGKAEVARRQAPGSNVLLPVATLGLGDVIGEIALLTQRPTSALVHAVERMAVLVLRREDFDEVIAQHPEVRALLASLAAQRQQGGQADVPSERLPGPGSPLDPTPLTLTEDDLEPWTVG